MVDAYKAVVEFTNPQLDSYIDSLLPKEIMIESEIVTGVPQPIPQYSEDFHAIKYAEELLDLEQLVTHFHNVCILTYQALDGDLSPLDTLHQAVAKSAHMTFRQEMCLGMYYMWRAPIRIRAEALYLTLIGAEWKEDD